MSLDPVPWFVGGEAEHSAEAARALAWVATNGRTGISRPGDMAVTPLTVPGNAVMVAPGGGSIESTYAGASGQSYTVSNTQSATVPIPANEGSTAVTRYVGVEVNDPQYAGAYPSDKANGPYNKFVVRSSLKQGTHPWLPLASIRMPANTATVTSSMITDIRELANPRRVERVHARPRVSADNGSQQNLRARTSDGGEYFPGGGGSANTFQVDVPDWAVMMIVEADWMSVRYQGGEVGWGRYWMEYGTEYRPGTWPNKRQWEFTTQHFGWDSAETTTNVTNWRLMDTRSVPQKLRGKRVTFAYKAGYDPKSKSTKTVSMSALGGLGCRVTFIEAPEGTWEDAN